MTRKRKHPRIMGYCGTCRTRFFHKWCFKKHENHDKVKYYYLTDITKELRESNKQKKV